MEYVTYTEIDLNKTPVKALQLKTRGKLSCMLNRRKIVLSPEKLPRDYRGLADLMNYRIGDCFWIEDDDYMKKLLDMWQEREDATIGRLLNFLERIDRYDVIDDVTEMFVEDAKLHERIKNVHIKPTIQEDPKILEMVLTLEDVQRVKQGMNLRVYDAFLLYHESDDEFAQEVMTKLESEPYNLHLFDKNRDFIGGLTFELESLMKLIHSRCSRMIVILSESFLQSNELKYFVSFAQALNYEKQHFTKVVPITYKKERLDLPESLKPFYVLNREQCEKLCNFWNKLHSSLILCAPDTVSETVKVEELPGNIPALEVSEKYYESSCMMKVKSGINEEPSDKVVEPENDALKSPSISMPSAKSAKKSKFPEQTSMPKISIKKFITNTITRMSKTKKKKITQPVACPAM